MKKSVSPCQHCVRVAAPADCENKQCPLWRYWFIHRWEQTRRAFLPRSGKGDV